MICIATMESGGAERQVTYIAKGFHELGHEVHVVLMKEGGNFIRLINSGAKIHFVSVFPNSLHFVFPIYRVIKKYSPDIVYLWQRPFDVLGGLAALCARTPSIHAERTDPERIVFSFKVLLRNFIVKKSKAIISNSEAGVHYWSRRTKGLNVIKIPNIIPYDEMIEVQPSNECKDHILIIGRHDSNKNLITLLRAVKILEEMGNYVSVTVAGEGPDTCNLIRFVKDQNIEDRVNFIGYQSDAWSLMKGCKCLVSLSFYEGEPNVVLEAAALGCNMILSDIPAHRAIEGLDEVIFVNPVSAKEVANAVLRIQRRTLSPNNSASHEFTYRSRESVCRKHLDVFYKVLSN